MDNCPLITLIKRVDLLDALCEEPRTPSELEQTTSISRATIHRTVDNLQEQGILQKNGQAFALTGPGRVLAEEVVSLRDRAQTVCNIERFLSAVDVTAVDIPIDALTDATIIHPDTTRAHRIEEMICDRVRTADSLRLFSGVVSPFYLEEIHDAVLDGSAVDAVFTPDAVEILFDAYSGLSKGAAREGDIEIRVGDESPFELFIYDGAVGVAAHGENGSPELFVESDAPEVLAWAEQMFDRYAVEAEHVKLF